MFVLGFIDFGSSAVLTAILTLMTTFITTTLPNIIIKDLIWETLIKGILIKKIIWGFISKAMISVVLAIICKWVAEFIFDAILKTFSLIKITPQMVYIGPVQDFMDTSKAVGVSLLILMASYAGLKSMFAYMGFEAEEPFKIMIRTGITGLFIISADKLFDFILGFYAASATFYAKVFSGGASIYSEGGIDSAAIEGFKDALAPKSVLSLLDAFNIFDPEGIAQVGIEAVLFLVVTWKLLQLLFRFAERYLLCIILVILGPMALACAPSTSTRPIFQGWIKIFFGNMVLQVMQILVLTMIFMSPSISVFNDGEILLYIIIIGAVGLLERAEDYVQAIQVTIGGGMNANAGIESVKSGVQNFVGRLPYSGAASSFMNTFKK